MKLTIKQFQQANNINKLEINDYDKSILFIKLIAEKTDEDVSKMSINKFNKLCSKILKSFNDIQNNITKNKHKRIIRIKNKFYFINYDIAKLDAGRYVETATFGVDLLDNLHKLMATMVVPMKWTLKGLKAMQYDAMNHEQIAEDMLQADFKNCYSSCLLFLESFKNLNSKYQVLFGTSDEEDENRTVDEFQKSFGWIYNAKLVSEFENISLDEVWDLPTLQFLNDLTYLKLKLDWDANELKKSTTRRYK